MTTEKIWSAPASLACLQQYGGSSSWSCVRFAAHKWAAVPLNHEPDGFSNIRLARTAGRALRNTRRFLSRNPIAFE